MKIFWSELAVERVGEIAEFIEQGYPEAVEKWVEAIFNRVMQLQSFPKSGRKVPEINREDIREIFYQNFRIVYRIEEKHISILTIRHSREVLKPEDIFE